ncbi:MAG: SufD family Fe-S cluster assembly protein [Dehalococcoidia bacterium]|nr:SufD family Fe-S cluster assembly protein [Dehalococcoidia bacterium]
MQAVTSSRGQAAELIDALSSRHNEPEWLRQRRLEAWRLYQGSSTESARLEALLSERSGDTSSRTGRVWSGRFGGVIEQWGREIVSHSLSPEIAREGIVFADLHSAARDHASLLRERLMSVVTPQENGDEALNGALWSGGALAYLPPDAQALEPLAYLAGGAESAFRRVLLVAERGSAATFVEAGVSTGKTPAASDSVAEIVLAEGARVRYIMLQDWGRSTDCRLTLRAVLGEGSRLDLMVAGTGGASTKAKLEAVLAAHGATARIVALTVAGGDQRLEYSTLQEHKAPETVSDLLFKSALRGRARLQWRGLTRVESGAAGADANQESRSLLLSDRAQARPMPVLEIEAHDVSRCSHGATVSSLDEEQLFYLMSRGLSGRQAETAIVEGFFRQALDRLDGDGVRSGIERVLRRRLTAGRRRSSDGE